MPAHNASTPSLDQRIGQLLMVGFKGKNPGDPEVEQLRAMIAEGKIGGVILMGHNVENPAQVRALNAHLQSAMPPHLGPLLIGVDQEGGLVQRLSAKKGFIGAPSAAEIAAAGPEAARHHYGQMARELRSLGFNVNFGPVLDTHVPGNPVIAAHGRSYGAHPEQIAAYARIFMEEHARHGILTAPKHFPGHGRSVGQDSHHQYTVLPPDLTGTRTDLAAFQRVLPHAPMVMSAHVYNPNLSADRRPASLSADVLRGHLPQMGFRGTVVSDDLNMRGAQGFGQPHVEALRAGNHLLLDTLADPRAAHAEIRAAVHRDPAIAQSLTESFQRVSELRQRLVALQAPAPQVQARPVSRV